MKQTPFTTLAGAFRAQIVKQWAMSSQLTSAEAMQKLTSFAVELQLVKRDAPVLGTTMASWAKGVSSIGTKSVTPLWAAQAALLLMINAGWMPGNDQEWAGTASLFVTLKGRQLESLLAALPTAWSVPVATGWLVAAIEQDERYLLNKKIGKG
ncbi:TPA: hypothetical protein MO340_004238 [Salmonella enterica subsp. salamae serovar 35:g,m,s,t:-]|nr:hypothetical protein [Salmonella enterica subsp. salamae serovar 35:g,m,s,t:-]HCA3549709.1 hypothetical protein [Salmonella enterica subsp. salamae serovar 35:g,m,s,t:-]